MFKNVADAEELVPRLADKMDIIGYNLEHGPANRPDEQADPVGSVKRMRALADKYGKELALGPDRAFALNDGVAMAPYVDMFVLQVQRVQTEPDVVREFVAPLAQALRRVNPDLEISVQVRTEGDVVAIADLIDSLEGSLDGVSILTSEETVDIAEALVAELRPPLPDLPGIPQGAPETAPESAPEEMPANSPPKTAQTAPRTARRRVAHDRPLPRGRRRRRQRRNSSPRRPPAPMTRLQRRRGCLPPLASMGILISALLATMWIYTLQNTRKR